MEVSLTSLKTQQLDTKKAEKELQLNLDLLKEKMTDASLRVVAYQ